MTNRSRVSGFRVSLLLPRLAGAIACAGSVFSVVACSDGATPAGAAGSSGSGATSTAGGTGGTAGTGVVTGGAGAGGSTGGTGLTAGAGGSVGGASAGSANTAGVAGTAPGAGMGGVSTAGAGGSTAGGAGAGGSAGAAMGGAGVGGGAGAAAGMAGTGIGGGAGSAGSGGAEDIDMQAEDFTCIADWAQVLGFRINNLLGHLDEAIAVAESDTGGVYPVGTVLQHLPTEAMVKRRAGFSPETNDWEFFLLQLSPQGVTTIVERGTTEIQTSMGQTCASCHTMVPDQFDFVCNTWGEQGSANCGFNFNDSFLNMQLATDTRCD